MQAQVSSRCVNHLTEVPMLINTRLASRLLSKTPLLPEVNLLIYRRWMR